MSAESEVMTRFNVRGRIAAAIVALDDGDPSYAHTLLEDLAVELANVPEAA